MCINAYYSTVIALPAGMNSPQLEKEENHTHSEKLTTSLYTYLNRGNVLSFFQKSYHSVGKKLLNLVS